MSETPNSDLLSESLAREHLANERTLLSWWRTGLNAMAAGMLLYLLVGAVEGTADFARIAAAVSIESRSEEFRFIGFSLVVFGAIVQVVALAKFIQYRVILRRGEPTTSAGVYLLIIFGFLLLGLAYIGYVVISG